MERYVPFTTGEYYHIYNRGVDKKKIFFSKGDWDHFQKLLFLRNGTKHLKVSRVQGAPLDTLCIGDSLVDICAYALMPNHFHLLLHEKSEGGITKFMSKLLTAFSMYMNKKYNRTGPLMCRPFRAKHIDSNEYYMWLISYIHANPIELIENEWKERGVQDFRKVKKYIDEYKYSSYVDYFSSKRAESSIINKSALLIDAAELEEISEIINQDRTEITNMFEEEYKGLD